MRKYSIDSESARGRVVAAALLADGALDKSEIDLLNREAIVESLGITHEVLDQTIHEFCDDLLQYAKRDDSGDLELGHDALEGILDEIHDRELQEQLLKAILEIATADREIAPGEAILASQAMLRWSITPEQIGYELHPYSPRWPRSFNRASMGGLLQA